MSGTRLTQIIEEMLNELSPELLTRYLDQLGYYGGQQGSRKKEKEMEKLKDKMVQQYIDGDREGAGETEKKIEKRVKGQRSAVDSIDRQKKDKEAKDAAEREKIIANYMGNGKGKVAFPDGRKPAIPGGGKVGSSLSPTKPTTTDLTGDKAELPTPEKISVPDNKGGMIHFPAPITGGKGKPPKKPAGTRPPLVHVPPLSGNKPTSTTSTPTPGDKDASKKPTKASDIVPPNVQAAVKRGGKVVFGHYYDALGTHLGSVRKGTWVPGKKKSFLLSPVVENKIIRLTDLLMENAERRVNLMKVQAIMEKLYPELTDTQTKKLMELCTEVHMMASQMNTIPYIRTESSLVEWTVLVVAFKAKVNELKEEVVKVCEDKKIDCTTAVKALDEVLTY